MSRISVKVKPNSRKREIKVQEGVIEIKLLSPPKEGKANAELIEILSRCLKISKSCIKIIKGQTSRMKMVEIEGIDREEVLRRVERCGRSR